MVSSISRAGHRPRPVIQDGQPANTPTPPGPRDVYEARSKKSKAPKKRKKPTANELYLTKKVKTLLHKRFKGSVKKAFAHYDKNNNRGVDKHELYKFLGDAGVGNIFTRGAWTNGVMKRFDTDKSKDISLKELMAAIPKKG